VPPEEGCRNYYISNVKNFLPKNQPEFQKHSFVGHLSYRSQEVGLGLAAHASLSMPFLLQKIIKGIHIQ
jgi:hypothetical protein